MIHAQAIATSAAPLSGVMARRPDSSTQISRASSTATSVSGRTWARSRYVSEHSTITISGERPLAPMRRAAPRSSPNARRVVIQRHASSPKTPPASQNGHSSALNPHDHGTSGFP